MNIEEYSPSPDSMISMKFITKDSGMTAQWFYKLIREGTFPHPIKLGRMSRWKFCEYTSWKSAKESLSRKAA